MYCHYPPDDALAGFEMERSQKGRPKRGIVGKEIRREKFEYTIFMNSTDLTTIT